MEWSLSLIFDVDVDEPKDRLFDKSSMVSVWEIIWWKARVDGERAFTMMVTDQTT
jgi:hypothetical protein